MHRKVEAGRGAGWIVDGLGRLNRHGGVFAGIGLLLGAMSALPGFAQLLGPLAGALIELALALVFALLGPVFHAGMVSAFDISHRGGVPGVGQLFDGFRRPGALARLAPVVLVLLMVMIGALVVVLISMGPTLFGMMEDGGEPKPDQILALLLPLGLMFVVLFPLAVLFGWMVFLAIPRAMLGGVPGFTALRESLGAIGANIGAFIINFLCWIALMMVMLLPMMLVTMVFAAVFSGNGTMQMLSQMIVSALFGAVYAVAYTASMYQAWLEIYAPESDAADLAASVAVEV